jgi:hypothetical protein
MLDSVMSAPHLANRMPQAIRILFGGTNGITNGREELCEAGSVNITNVARHIDDKSVK